VRFANTFVALQEQRLKADYDPASLLDEAAAFDFVNDAEAAIAAFDAEPAEARRAFVVFIALEPKNRA
jgi:hypothetical protein